MRDHRVHSGDCFHVQHQRWPETMYSHPPDLKSEPKTKLCNVSLYEGKLDLARVNFPV